MKIIPVIIAGGNGSRLWPLSRSMYPKQFLPLANEKSTMFQDTIGRFKGLNAEKPIVICNNEHRFLVAEQLAAIGKEAHIVLEPIGKNTAPAITVAAMLAQQEYGEDTVLLVLPADHAVRDRDAFCETVASAMSLAQEGKLVTFGIVPKSPHTGYGYIKTGSAAEQGFVVDSFKEKPNKELAESYLSDGRYLWNSGMFFFRADSFLKEIKDYEPALYDCCEKTLSNAVVDLDFIRLEHDSFNQCHDISIDYAVMEKTKDAVVFPLGTDWSDLGAWSAIWEQNNRDEHGNACRGQVISRDTNDCLIYGSDRLVATVGLENMVVVDTKDAILIAPKDRCEEVKQIVEELKDQNSSQVVNHREVRRPWGKYDSIDSGDRYQAKRITVKPGEKLSVQMHHHRAEHWIVVTGTAKVTRGEETLLVSENESTYIPIGVVHALENPGKIPLEMIEVQSGSYLGEDDIVRFEDRYGRN